MFISPKRFGGSTTNRQSPAPALINGAGDFTMWSLLVDGQGSGGPLALAAAADAALTAAACAYASLHRKMIGPETQ